MELDAREAAAHVGVLARPDEDERILRQRAAEAGRREGFAAGPQLRALEQRLAEALEVAGAESKQKHLDVPELNVKTARRYFQRVV